MTTQTETFAHIINDVIFAQGRPQSRKLETAPHTEVFVTGEGRLQNAGWRVNTVVSSNQHSVAFSVQLSGGRAGYATDLLLHHVNEVIIREYAEYALSQMLERNGWKT